VSSLDGRDLQLTCSRSNDRGRLDGRHVCCESDLDLTSAELDRYEQLAQCRPLRVRRLPLLAHSVASRCSHVAVGEAGSSSTGWEVLCVNGSEPEHARGV
jgi:hypothetical protein